jgi:glycosyltransferase involved in cell wall biosynthesis
MNRLRIAQIAPPWFAVPPNGYGGAEWVVSILAEGLVARGHDVTLFAAGGSKTAGRLVETFERAPSLEIGDPIVEGEHLVAAYGRWREFDVIHDHTALGLIAGASLPVPVVHTVHGPATKRMYNFYQRLGERVHLVSISQNQAGTLPPNCPVEVIHNGIEVAKYPYSAEHGDYLLFVGRASPEKGPVEAIEIARGAGMPLRMLLKVNEEEERRYFETMVRPALDGVDVHLQYQVTHEEKAEAYRGALATLFPIQWPEPFGLVMTESMATGTPVIAFRQGSAPEVIADGVTGFLCDDVDGAVGAVSRVRGINRKECRDRVELQFGSALNVVRHEALYQRIVAGKEPMAEAMEVAEQFDHAGNRGSE